MFIFPIFITTIGRWWCSINNIACHLFFIYIFFVFMCFTFFFASLVEAVDHPCHLSLCEYLCALEFFSDSGERKKWKGFTWYLYCNDSWNMVYASYTNLSSLYFSKGNIYIYIFCTPNMINTLYTRVSSRKKKLSIMMTSYVRKWNGEGIRKITRCHDISLKRQISGKREYFVISVKTAAALS